jgi:hypothetical protein
MRRHPLALIAACTLAACSSGDSGTNPQPDIAEAYIGAWTLNVPAVANCWAAFQLHFDVTIAHVDAFRGQTSFSFEDPNGWYAGSAATRYPFSANVNGTNRTFLLRFGAGSPVHYAELAGGDPNKDYFTGTFSDPDGVFKTQSGTRPCETVAQAVRAP